MTRRTATAIRFPEEVHTALQVAADERYLSINYLVVAACREFLEHLVPVDEFRLTRSPGITQELPQPDTDIAAIRKPSARTGESSIQRLLREAKESDDAGEIDRRHQ